MSVRCSSTENRRLSGLAESLRFELAMYDIGVHVFAPCTMYTPGYEAEMQTKPAITKKIEETDEGLSPEQAARAMLAGTRTVRKSRIFTYLT
jgi:3-dehydrosphinganine reductase